MDKAAKILPEDGKEPTSNWVTLTARGKRKIEDYIRELQAKRKEILDAGKDTADETPIPTIEDIMSEIPVFEENGQYLNAWGVTDHYNADRALSLIRGLDYTAKCSPGHKLLTNIDWDDGDDPSDPDDPMFAQPTLPTEVEVEESMYGDEIADYLSDTFGYLVNEWIERKNGWKQNV